MRTAAHLLLHEAHRLFPGLPELGHEGLRVHWLGGWRAGAGGRGGGNAAGALRAHPVSALCPVVLPPLEEVAPTLLLPALDGLHNAHTALASASERIPV